MKSDSLSEGSCRMRERMSFAGRRDGLEDWVRWAALRAFLALEREGVGLWVGDGEESEREESLSFKVGSEAVDGGSGIMSSLDSWEVGRFMLAKETSGSSRS